MYPIEPLLPTFLDLGGSPLDAGKVYFGQQGQNPITHPIPVYWDAAGTQPAAQPIRTTAGYLSRNGAPARVYAAEQCSALVRTARGALVLTVDSLAGIGALSAPSGAGLIGLNPSLAYPPDTVGSALSGSINVLDYLSAAQIANAHQRLGTLDCGPGLQLAISAAAGKTLHWPAGYVFASAQELIVRSAQVWEGGGKGNVLTPFASQTYPITELRTLGDGTTYKTVKTRAKYRGSAADPQDDPISALVNVQHPAFEMHGMVLRCGYDQAQIMSNPAYLGDNWDVGLFVGCRLHSKIKASAVLGCWRVAAIYQDVTRCPGTPELLGWDGIQHPQAGTQYGGDGCSIEDVTVWGGKWGVLIKGADPKPGYGSYGIDYTNSLGITIGTLPEEGDTLTLGEVTLTFSVAPSSIFQVAIGGTVEITASNVVDACITIVESTASYPIFRSAIYLSIGGVITALLRNEVSGEFAATFTANTASGGRITFTTTAKRLGAKLVTLPVNGDTVRFGEVVFTFKSAPVAVTDVLIDATTSLTAENLRDAALAVLAGAGAYPIFRSASYVLFRNMVTTLPVASQVAYYTANFTSAVSAPTERALLISDAIGPSVINDPAPYYDQGLGATVTDRRGNYGFSDFVIRDSQIFGSANPLGHARQAIRADRDWKIDTAGGAFYIDGLSGNPSRMLHGHRYYNVRFDGKYDPFSVRLGKTQRDDFYSCHWDGTSVAGFTYPDGTTANDDPMLVKYGAVTRLPLVTRRVRFFGRDISPYSDYFAMDDRGSANVASGNGLTEFTGNVYVYNGRSVVDRSAYYNGSAQFAAIGGSAGSSRYEFLSPSGTQGGLRYYFGSGTLRLACSGNLNTVLWANNSSTKTATQTLTCTDSTGTGVYTSDGAVRVSAAAGDAEVWSGAGGSFRVRNGSTTNMTLTSSLLTLTVTSAVRSTLDNSVTLGAAAQRWSVVYAGTGAINTSDERVKQQAQPVTAAVLRAWGRVGYVQYKFNDAVAQKGDGARWHFGLIAQRVKEAFEAEGLDPFGYGILCYDEWPDEFEDVMGMRTVQAGLEDETIEEREEHCLTGEKRLLTAAGNRYGIRYEEALALECAYARHNEDALRLEIADLRDKLSQILTG